MCDIEQRFPKWGPNLISCAVLLEHLRSLFERNYFESFKIEIETKYVFVYH